VTGVSTGFGDQRVLYTQSVNSALQQFLTIPLPIMVTLVVTVWAAQWPQNKRVEDLNKHIDDLNKALSNRIDDMNKSLNARIDDLRSDVNRRFDEVMHRLDLIESKLEDHDDRIARVEERTSPLRPR
jgi:hypothetical protein